MSTNESLTQSDEIPSEQAITIQPSGITAYPGSGDWLPAGGNDPAQEARRWLGRVARGPAALAGDSVDRTGVCGRDWDCPLVVAASRSTRPRPSWSWPRPTPRFSATTADQAQQVQNEFEIFRDTQQSLIKSRFVIMAALRDPKLKNRGLHPPTRMPSTIPSNG